jgi:hypothetical protein
VDQNQHPSTTKVYGRLSTTRTIHIGIEAPNDQTRTIGAKVVTRPPSNDIPAQIIATQVNQDQKFNTHDSGGGDDCPGGEAWFLNRLKKGTSVTPVIMTRSCCTAPKSTPLAVIKMNTTTATPRSNAGPIAIKFCALMGGAEEQDGNFQRRLGEVDPIEPAFTERAKRARRSAEQDRQHQLPRTRCGRTAALPTAPMRSRRPTP